MIIEVPDTSEIAASGYKAAKMEESWFKKAAEGGIPVAAHRWVTDSISKFELCPLDGFLIKK